MADRSIKINLGVNVSGLTAGFRTAQKSAQDFTGKLNKAVRENSAEIGDLTNKLGGLGLAATAGVALAVKKFADFDQAMSNVAASTMESTANMEKLRAAALDAGARTIYSATEAAAAVEELAKAGISTADVLGGGLDGALDLAAAGGIGVAEAAETAASAMTQFGLAGDDVTHIADLLAAGAGKAQGGVSDLGQALGQSGLVASQMGLSIEETVGSLTAFASAGLTGSDAGTSFRAMLLRLANPTKESGLLMEELGINAYDAGGNFVGMSNLAGQLQSSLSGLTQAERDQALAQIFGQDAIRTSNLLYREGAAGITEWTASVNDSGYAAEVSAKRMDNLAGDLEGLSGSFETLLIGMGEGANGPLRSLVQGADRAVDALNGLPDPIKQGTLLLTGAGGLTALGVAGLGKLVVSIDSTRTSLKALGISAKTAGRLVGGVGGALTIATAGVMAWADAAAQAEARTAGLKDTLGELGRVTDETRAEVVKNLGETKNAFLGLSAFDETFSPIEAAKVLGIELDTLTDAALGNADAMQAVYEATTRYDGNISATGDAARAAGVSLSDYAVAGGIVEDAVKGTNESLEVAIQRAKDEEAALGGVKGAAEAAVPAIESTSTAFDDQAEAADNAWDSIKSLTDGMAGLRDSQRGFEAAIDDARKALKENGATLDITTAKGRENQAALDDIAVSGMEWVDSLREQGASQEELQGAMGRTRESFVKTAEKMGMSRKAAKELANQLGLIPGKVTSTVEVNTSKAKGIIDRFISDQAKRQISINVVANTGGGGPRGVQMKASGGSVSGPGTGTSDSIPALLSNGEHVFTASDVAKAGGQSAMYRMRGMIQSGLLRFAAGGAVSAAKDDQADALRRVRALKKSVLAARSDERAADRAYSRIDGDKENREAKKAAKRRLDAAKKDTKRAENALERARDAYDAAKAKTASLRDSRADLSLDVRRGNIVDQGTSGLSGALSVVDRVLAASQDSNLSSGKRSGLAKRAAAAEPALKRQYDLLKQANTAIEEQRGLTQDVLSLRDQIANSIKGEVKLTDTLGGKTDLGYDKPVTSGAIRAYVQEKLGKINTLNARVNALRLKGVPNGLIQEILAAGVDGGSELAQALLTGPASDLAAISSTWGHIEQAALNTGGIATLSQYNTTAYQAEAELARRETAADKIETSIENLISSLQQGLINSYGDPKNKVQGLLGMAVGGWVSGGIRGKDSVPRLLMPDEFVVNAKSAKANASLLEAVNSGVRLSLPSVSRPAIQAAPVGGSSVDAVAAITAALTQMSVQVVNQFGVRESARIVSAGIGEVARNDPGQLRGAMTKAGV